MNKWKNSKWVKVSHDAVQGAFSGNCQIRALCNEAAATPAESIRVYKAVLKQAEEWGWSMDGSQVEFIGNRIRGQHYRKLGRVAKQAFEKGLMSEEEEKFAEWAVYPTIYNLYRKMGYTFTTSKTGQLEEAPDRCILMVIKHAVAKRDFEIWDNWNSTQNPRNATRPAWIFGWWTRSKQSNIAKLIKNCS